MNAGRRFFFLLPPPFLLTRLRYSIAKRGKTQATARDLRQVNGGALGAVQRNTQVVWTLLSGEGKKRERDGGGGIGPGEPWGWVQGV